MPGYDAVSVQRVRQLGGSVLAPGGKPHAERDFVAVARLVPKKNLQTLIRAYARYADGNPASRRLNILGDGPLEAELKALADSLGVADKIGFAGFVQTEEVAKTLSRSLALILPSVEEQFGLVVIEAMALGLPVIVSENVGARDELVRTGVNGFVIEPDNIEGMVDAMDRLAGDEMAWARMCSKSTEMVAAGDAPRFGRGVAQLAGVKLHTVPTVNIAVSGRFHLLNYASSLQSSGRLNKFYFSHKFSTAKAAGLKPEHASNAFLPQYLTQGRAVSSATVLANGRILLLAGSGPRRFWPDGRRQHSARCR